MALLVGCGDDGGSGDAGLDAGPPADAAVDAAGDAGDDGGAPADLDACFEGLTRRGEYFIAIQDMVDAPRTLRVRYARESTGVGTGETWNYETRRFGLQRDGSLLCVTDDASLRYVGAHHNWDDSVVAVAGGREYEVNLLYDIVTGGGWQYTLTVRDAGTMAIVEGPIDLTPDGCVGDPGDTGCVF